MPKKLPPFNNLDLLRSIYQEISAPRLPYFKTIILKSYKGSPTPQEETVVHTDPDHIALTKAGHRNVSKVVVSRQFVEETIGSLYAPASVLGYRNLDYENALNFKIDCDLARQKTGDILDGAVHYISEAVTDDKIVRKRQNLNKRGFRPKPNSRDIEERYLANPRISDSEKDEIRRWLKKNREKLDNSSNFNRESYTGIVADRSVSASAGPDDLGDQEDFLSWLVYSPRTSNQKRRLDQIDEDEGSR